MNGHELQLFGHHGSIQEYLLPFLPKKLLSLFPFPLFLFPFFFHFSSSFISFLAKQRRNFWNPFS